MEKPEIVRQSFLRQAQSCDDLGSPFTARLCKLAAARLEDDTAVGKYVLRWTGDPAGTGDALALRLAGSLHALVLSGRAPSLAAAYPPHTIDDDALWAACEAAFREHEGFILERLKSAPQTNEVRRSAALLPGFLTIAALTGKPLVLSEIGVSAGLNLQWDRYRYRLGNSLWGPDSTVVLEPDWQGDAPPAADLSVLDRAGCDLNPLDPSAAADRLRLESYIWADQKDRLERIRNALEIARSNSLTVERADAIDWLRRRLASRFRGAVHVIYHTIAWQYLSDALKEEGETLIRKAGREASNDAPIARLQLEADGKPDGAALTLEIWPSGERQEIGRADFHGRWIKWQGWAGL
ncbi:DUF2332 domain-containing protein [Ciceribacter azotifigens]|uniref:DUF2332 domain-containing protein n=1 Tax=Ciceribacter azotifigens TaxID=2069303 RepID=UPI003A8456AB